MHKHSTLDLSDLNCDRLRRPVGAAFTAYSRSKLANVFFTRELADRLEGSGAACCSLCPGVVDTDIKRHLMSSSDVSNSSSTSTSTNDHNVFNSLAAYFCRTFMKSPLEGAATTLHCVLAPDLVNGAHYSDCEMESSVKSCSSAKTLWEVSEKMVGLD